MFSIVTYCKGNVCWNKLHIEYDRQSQQPQVQISNANIQSKNEAGIDDVYKLAYKS